MPGVVVHPEQRECRCSAVLAASSSTMRGLLVGDAASPSARFCVGT